MALYPISSGPVSYRPPIRRRIPGMADDGTYQAGPYRMGNPTVSYRTPGQRAGLAPVNTQSAVVLQGLMSGRGNRGLAGGRVISNPQVEAKKARAAAAGLSPEKQAGLDILNILNPQVAAITGALQARAKAGGEAISGYTNQLAQNLASMDLGAGYTGALTSQAASDAALSQMLAGQGTELAQGLGQRLADINAPGAVQQSTAPIAQAGQGAAGALYGIGSAERGNLIAQQAQARQYGATLPGIAGLAGAQGISALQRQVAGDLGERVGDLVARVPELVMNREQQLRENKRQAAADALAQRQFALQERTAAQEQGQRIWERTNLSPEARESRRQFDLTTREGRRQFNLGRKDENYWARKNYGLTKKELIANIGDQNWTQKQKVREFNWLKKTDTDEIRLANAKDDREERQLTQSIIDSGIQNKISMGTLELARQKLGISNEQFYANLGLQREQLQALNTYRMGSLDIAGTNADTNAIRASNAAIIAQAQKNRAWRNDYRTYFGEDPITHKKTLDWRNYQNDIRRLDIAARRRTGGLSGEALRKAKGDAFDVARDYFQGVPADQSATGKEIPPTSYQVALKDMTHKFGLKIAQEALNSFWNERAPNAKIIHLPGKIGGYIYFEDNEGKPEEWEGGAGRPLVSFQGRQRVKKATQAMANSVGLR